MIEPVSQKAEMLSGFDAVVFDLGGVLIDWSPRCLYRKMFDSEREITRFLETVWTSDWNRKVDEGLPFTEAVSSLTARYPEWRREIESYDSCWEEMLGGCIKESIRVLETLRDDGVPLYSLTNFSAESSSPPGGASGFWSGWRTSSSPERRVSPSRTGGYTRRSLSEPE